MAFNQMGEIWHFHNPVYSMVHVTRLCEGILLREQTGTSTINVINKCAAEKHLADDKNVAALTDREQFALMEVQKGGTTER